MHFSNSSIVECIICTFSITFQTYIWALVMILVYVYFIGVYDLVGVKAQKDE